MQSSHLALNQVAVQLRSSVPSSNTRQQILSNISFALPKGDIACILGPSGCGKSTLLRAIAGFEPISHGTIVLNQQQVSSVSQHVPPERRKTGVVFQDYALFPHLTVRENIRFGIRHLEKSLQVDRIEELCRLVELKGFEERFPHELSGGQQQRVALARALAPKPDLLLLDEPFSSLDTALRLRIAKEVRAILKESGTTALLVTHDQEEAFAFADMLGILLAGQLEQWADAYTLYHSPATIGVAQFIGQGTLLPIQTASVDRFLETPVGTIVCADVKAQQQYQVFVRPENLELTENPSSPFAIQSSYFAGNHYMHQIVHLDSQQPYAVYTEQALKPLNTTNYTVALKPTVQPMVFKVS